jgi:two-component system probable response regulator PhcQ
MTQRLLSPVPTSTGTPCVLYVDDEVKAQQYFKEAFEDEFTIFTASSAAEAYRLLLEEKDRIGILISDQRMPGESGVELLDKARRLNPNLIRILVTAYTDYNTAIQAVNDGRIFRYVHKPWDAEEMQTILQRAAEQYLILVERERLLAEKAEAIRHMLMADKVASFGILAEGLNHHIRNALTVIRAFVDLAPLKLSEELQGGSPEVDPSFWDDLHSQAQHQISRIQTVLHRLGEASQRPDVALSDPIDLTALLDETALIYTHAFATKNVHCSHYVHPSVPMIRGNIERLRQLWRLLYADLLANLSTGDQVRISVDVVSEISGRPVVQMIIDDTGAWSSHENVANLFDPFFVRSHQPHELGVNLTACYVIVHLHGGSIEAIPRESGGLRIQITLPIDPTDRPSDTDSFFNRLIEHEQRWKQRED